MADDKDSLRYNGWANSPTLLIQNFLLGNEPVALNAAAIMNNEQSLEAAGQALRAWVEDGMPRLVDEEGLYADLLGWALAWVDWEVIAHAIVSSAPGMVEGG